MSELNWNWKYNIQLIIYNNKYNIQLINKFKLFILTLIHAIIYNFIVYLFF